MQSALGWTCGTWLALELLFHSRHQGMLMGREQRQESYSGPVSPIFRLLTAVRGQGKSSKRHFTEIPCVVF